MGNTWKSFYELTQLTSNVWHYLLVIQLLESPTYKVRFPFVVINGSSHYWCQHPAQQVTPCGVPILGWWALIVHVCASVTMPSKCHPPSPVWSLRRKKWIKSIDFILNSPWKNRSFFYFLFMSSTRETFYLLTSYYLNKQLICLINIFYFSLDILDKQVLWKIYAHSSVFSWVEIFIVKAFSRWVHLYKKFDVRNSNEQNRISLKYMEFCCRIFSLTLPYLIGKNLCVTLRQNRSEREGKN